MLDEKALLWRLRFSGPVEIQDGACGNFLLHCCRTFQRPLFSRSSALFRSISADKRSCKSIAEILL
jgi:hypothetical protein